jgi:hypothetical protein
MINVEYLGIQIAPTSRRTVEIWRKVQLNCFVVLQMDPGNQDSFSSLEVIFYNYWHRMGKKKKKKGGKEREIK